MPRHILDENHIHPAIRDKVALHHQSVVQAVQAALVSHAVVVVGMKANPLVGKACALLAAAGIEHHYMEYGGYLSQWRLRNALKMWTGWPTFPMVFVKGMLVGGFEDLKALQDAGQLRDLLG
jgi:glutaredoxin-related protein